MLRLLMCGGLLWSGKKNVTLRPRFTNCYRLDIRKNLNTPDGSGEFLVLSIDIRDMKKRKILFGVLLLLVVVLNSCSEITDFENQEEQGLLSLSLGTTKANFTSTRAVVESAYSNTDNYTVVVTDKDGIEKLRCSGAEVPTKMPITMTQGNYKVKAYYGNEHDASRDDFFVYGEVIGNVKAEQKEEVEVVCTPTCGRIAVNFDSSLKNYFSDYKVEFTGTEALGSKKIEWLKEDTAPWYVKLKEGGEELTYIITATTKEEFQPVEVQTKTFKLKRNEGYKLNISANYIPSEVGNGKIIITIDESTNDKSVDIEVPLEWI